jgi:hypothetical protein
MSQIFGRSRDKDFEDRLDTLKQLQTFVLDSDITITDENRRALRLDHIAEERDWDAVNDRIALLRLSLSTDEKANFSLKKTRKFLAKLPMFLMVFSVLAFAVAMFTPSVGLDDLLGTPIDPDQRAISWQFSAFLLWTITSGSLGAVAYLAVNALHIQQDVTFNMSDHCCPVKK